MSNYKDGNDGNENLYQPLCLLRQRGGTVLVFSPLRALNQTRSSKTPNITGHLLRTHLF